MGRFCQLVIGPAGCGKSTYCYALSHHLQTIKRPAYVINLDPAAEKFHYQPTVDIRDLISLEDVMEELELGPNGGLMYCMEYLLQNLDWLEEEIDTEWEDEYVIIDCPGQIELYTHSPLMRQLIQALQQRFHFRVCVVYLLESQFITDVTKYYSGVLTAMSAMVQLEVPHINVLSKMDLIEGRPGEMMTAKGVSKLVIDSHDPADMITKIQGNADPDAPKSGYVNTWTEAEEEERDRRRELLELDRFLEPDPCLLMDKAAGTMNDGGAGNDRWKHLNEAIVHLIDDFSMVAFHPLNIHDEESIESILMNIDVAIQYGEDEEIKEPKDTEEEEDGSDKEADGGAGYDGEQVVEESWRSVLDKE